MPASARSTLDATLDELKLSFGWRKPAAQVRDGRTPNEYPSGEPEPKPYPSGATMRTAKHRERAGSAKIGRLQAARIFVEAGSEGATLTA
jgi:hypothetical protein